MAREYEASMFGGEFPYWQDKYGWDYSSNSRYPERLNDLQENRLLAESLNRVGITPSMSVAEITSKYALNALDIDKGDYIVGKDKEGENIYNKENVESLLSDLFIKSGVPPWIQYGDAVSMFRKFWDQRGKLRKPDKYEWPTVDLKFRPDIAGQPSIKKWNALMPGDEVAETIEWEVPETVRKMAKGGLLSGAAIVGEAGPELVVGNAEVVPLPTKEEEAFWANHPDPKFHAAQFTLRTDRIIEEAEKAEKERRDKRSQQKWDAIRRARQYDAIAQRLWT